MAFTADKVRQGVQKDTGYSIDNSLRFNDDDSAYLSRTPSSAGNRKTWTFSCWIKRGTIGTAQVLFGTGTPATGTSFGGMYLDGTKNGVYIYDPGNGCAKLTTDVLRDPSAWYHIVGVMDATNTVARIYINGEEVTDFRTGEAVNPSNADGNCNNNTAHSVGRNGTADGQPFDGHMAEVHFIDGQALDHTSFGETGDYGEWKPIEVTGMNYGTNGFYLDFSNSGSLGTDASSNTNNWTVNNLAATDQMLDTPTNNFATHNVLYEPLGTYSEGNLKWIGPGAWAWSPSTIALPLTGKWYFETMLVNNGRNANDTYGSMGVMRTSTVRVADSWSGIIADALLMTDGYLGYNFSTTDSFTGTENKSAGDILSCAIDRDNNTYNFRLNNSSIWSGTLASSTTEGLNFVVVSHSASYGGTMITNYGQDSSFAGNKTAQGNQDSNSIGDFYYTPPTDFLALCTSNLPDPAVIPSEHFNTVLWTGDGASKSITGVGFQPDLVWGKNRAVAWNNTLFDAVRGAGELLQSNLTNAESTNDTWGYVNSFDTDGFSLVTGASGIDQVNENLKAFVAWNWKAGGTGVSNTNGSITSTVSANADAGFSIVSYTHTGNDETVGHGLSKAPEMVIIKGRNVSTSWYVLTTLIDGSLDYLLLESTAAKGNLGYSSPTANTFPSLQFSNGNTAIAYCFHSVDGYSKVGSYTGNGSTDGTFVHCGFRPAYVMFKRTAAASDWVILDSSRGTHNPTGNALEADTSDAESSFSDRVDFVSNGFKMRISSFPNGSSVPFIYIAFAETPFKHTNAR